jgi:hypothetical protein
MRTAELVPSTMGASSPGSLQYVTNSRMLPGALPIQENYIIVFDNMAWWAIAVPLFPW